MTSRNGARVEEMEYVGMALTQAAQVGIHRTPEKHFKQGQRSNEENAEILKSQYDSYFSLIFETNLENEENLKLLGLGMRSPRKIYFENLFNFTTNILCNIFSSGSTNFLTFTMF